jgi:hypothetical protein
VGKRTGRNKNLSRGSNSRILLKLKTKGDEKMLIALAAIGIATALAAFMTNGFTNL